MEVNQITKITICQELFEAGLPKSHVADKLDVNRETVRIWLRGINEIESSNRSLRKECLGWNKYKQKDLG